MRAFHTRSTLAIAILACLLLTTRATVGAEPKTPAPTSEDTAVATEIEHRLSDDRAVNAQQVVIEVRNGVVTLRGRVPNEDAKKRAEALANAVAGVDEVRNHLTPGTSGEKFDRQRIPDEMPGAR